MSAKTKKRRTTNDDYAFYHYRFLIVIEPCEEGGYFAKCPALQGCYVQGETYEETLSEMREAVISHIKDRLNNGEEIPQDMTMTAQLGEY